MSPEEILAEMRDIHLPGGLQSAVPARFAPEPFIVLAVVLAVLGLVWWRRRTQWRREAAEALRAAQSEPDIARRWSLLSGLVARVGRHRRAPPPDCLFLPPERIGPDETEMLAGHIRRMIGGRTGSAEAPGR